MIRLMSLAALAAFAVAAPASAEDGVRVSLSGKSAEQIHSEVKHAAASVCRRATSEETFFVAAYNTCYRATMKQTFEKIGDPQLMAMAGFKVARR